MLEQIRDLLLSQKDFLRHPATSEPRQRGTTCDLKERRAVQRFNHSWQRDYLAKDDVSISKIGFRWSPRSTGISLTGCTNKLQHDTRPVVRQN